MAMSVISSIPQLLHQSPLHQQPPQPTQSPKQRLTSSGLRFREPSQDRPFVCPFANCGGRFHRKFTLHEHMKTHTGEQPHQCPIKSCGKRFSTSGNLARHKRLHALHKMECPVAGCTRIFTSQEMLAKHQKVHAGSAVHSCVLPGCGKTFSTAGNLTRHMKTQHGLSNSLHRPSRHHQSHNVRHGDMKSFSKSLSPTHSTSSHHTAVSSPASSSNESPNEEFPMVDYERLLFIAPPSERQPFDQMHLRFPQQPPVQMHLPQHVHHQFPTAAVLSDTDLQHLFECLF
ncbi:Zinc finger protein 76, partial [Globisporangium splendens]